MPFPPELEAEFLNWLETEAKHNEYLKKILKRYEREAALQFFMYRNGYKNRKYALKLIKRFGAAYKID